MAFNALAVGIRFALTFIVAVTGSGPGVSFLRSGRPSLIAFEQNAVIYLMNSDGTDGGVSSQVAVSSGPPTARRSLSIGRTRTRYG